jgi:acetylornithine deacetylase/succinyl-diaminopimelate desuccinylase-like protein
LEGRQDEIWFAESGHVTLVLTVFGQASHAMYPWLGVNAIDKITEVLLELQGLQEELKEERSIIPGLSHSTINVGVIKGGTKSNVVPDSCSIDIDLRVIPEVDIAQVIGKIEKILENLSRKDPGFKAELKILMKAEPSMTPSDTPIIEVIKRVCRGLLGFEPLPVGLHADSDGKYFRNQGIPSIHWGVGTAENRGHAADEFIEIKDLVELSAAHALVCMEFLGYETEK